MRLRLQKQITQGVGGVAAVGVLAADGHVEADGEAGKVAGAVGIAQVDHLIELQPQAFGQFQRLGKRHARFHAALKVGEEILIHAPGREGGGVALHLQDDVKEPGGLQSLVIRLGRPPGELAADAGHFGEARLGVFGIEVFRQIGVAAHEGLRALHDDLYAAVEVALVCRGVFQMFLRLGA